MKGGIMCFLELFANIKKVSLTAGHHDADQRSVICAKALWSAHQVELGYSHDRKCVSPNVKIQYLHCFV